MIALVYPDVGQRDYSTCQLEISGAISRDFGCKTAERITGVGPPDYCSRNICNKSTAKLTGPIFMITNHLF